jgi:hypothetical protein
MTYDSRLASSRCDQVETDKRRGSIRHMAIASALTILAIPGVATTYAHPIIAWGCSEAFEGVEYAVRVPQNLTGPLPELLAA